MSLTGLTSVAEHKLMCWQSFLQQKQIESVLGFSRPVSEVQQEKKLDGNIIQCNECCISRVAMDVFMGSTDSKSHPLLPGTVRRVASMAEEHRHSRGSTSS